MYQIVPLPILLQILVLVVARIVPYQDVIGVFFVFLRRMRFPVHREVGHPRLVVIEVDDIFRRQCIVAGGVVERVDVFHISQRLGQSGTVTEAEGGVRLDEFGRRHLLGNLGLQRAVLVVVSADVNQGQDYQGCSENVPQRLAERDEPC